MTTDQPTKPPLGLGLDNPHAVQLWDRVHDAIDREHGKLIADLPQFGAGAIGQEVAFAAKHWGEEAQETLDVIELASPPDAARAVNLPPPEAMHGYADQFPGTDDPDPDAGYRIVDEIMRGRLADGTIAPLELASGLSAREVLEGDQAVIGYRPGSELGIPTADDAEALGRWLIGWAARRRQ